MSSEEETKKFIDTSEESFLELDTAKAGFLNTSQLKDLMDKISDKLGISRPNESDINEAQKAIDPESIGKFSCENFKTFIRASFGGDF